MENMKIFIVVTINYAEYVHFTSIFETYIKSNFEQILKKKIPLNMGILNNYILIVNGKITAFYSILMVINNKKM